MSIDTNFVRDAVLLLVRLVLAVAFFNETTLKLTGEKRFAKNDGIPLPVAWLVTMAEFAASLAFLTGILARPAGGGVMILMLFTTSLHVFKWHSTYRAARGGWEYDVLMFALAAVTLAFGAGAYAIH